MTANSYLEYALTMLGWLINNGIWHTITATGLFALPLLFRLISLWLKAREQGADEGDAGGLTLAWMENTVYTSLVVIMFTCVPLLNIDITNITYDVQRSKQCNYLVPAKPEQTGYAPLVNDVSGKTAAVPVWWYLVHTVSKGMVSAASATLPCKPDLRQLRFEVQHTRINDKVLEQELTDFVQECYAPSLARLKQRGVVIQSEDEDQDIAWPGSRRFLTESGYYDTDHARSPRSRWPYNSSRDAGLTDTGNGGYPTCKQWWSDADSGLSDRLLAQVKPDVWDGFRKLAYSKEQYEEAVLRTLVSPRNMEVSQNGRVYVGFGGNVDPTMTNDLTSLGATAGQSLASLAAFPAFDSIRQSLPMVQAILLMALVICIPLVTVFSAYNLKVVITLTFAQFALMFLTFWWELARWLDGTLIDMLYSSDTHSAWNLVGLQNTQDDIVLSFVTGSMFLVLPAFWMGALSWAGIRLGGVIENATRAGTRNVEQAGSKAGDIAQKILGAISSGSSKG
ncbi:conjugal transfer protein TraG N-terminal domain-containing protein [Citrobacter sp. S2-9]|uniref:Conjugal transfer protein TraG N-terminal domain-containing protein n=1 Tax=Citrobacter enshiensis TaxID=2971264 RepID=A0ABT8PXB1_9ENTR|nr:conjugal transfer protein TraG N-terminal domain-containing protein [Citrobacter enshiensis]MDN8600321.1 conjugal transfer protein TraG N-terminal domain-containing protein [Citrobacter enshiensis]